ncbi:uncharacterized protein N7515_010196 [Penicillium bovifimosum]|uniref:Uncharacterized protein n=1 Tax=Penicillium bovifimosum TaxID=126998 RepID=A0A9W9GI25_9EURO|nr:uncharacterized protein N7515_010196 [Penicillium bovifimosum]KAJ5120808.1 hypothetical protein N7515_010196 [Penicillium bovifimosum]
MTAEFIGYNVLMTLKEPAGGRLVGQVANVFGQRLLLQDGENEGRWLTEPSPVALATRVVGAGGRTAVG